MFLEKTSIKLSIYQRGIFGGEKFCSFTWNILVCLPFCHQNENNMPCVAAPARRMRNALCRATPADPEMHEQYKKWYCQMPLNFEVSSCLSKWTLEKLTQMTWRKHPIQFVEAYTYTQNLNYILWTNIMIIAVSISMQ